MVTLTSSDKPLIGEPAVPAAGQRGQEVEHGQPGADGVFDDVVELGPGQPLAAEILIAGNELVPYPADGGISVAPMNAIGSVRVNPCRGSGVTNPSLYFFSVAALEIISLYSPSGLVRSTLRHKASASCLQFRSIGARSRFACGVPYYGESRSSTLVAARIRPGISCMVAA